MFMAPNHTKLIFAPFCKAVGKIMFQSLRKLDNAIREGLRAKPSHSIHAIIDRIPNCLGVHHAK